MRIILPSSRIDTAQLAFELHALVHEANWYYNPFQHKRAFERARTGVLDRLRQGVTTLRCRECLANAAPLEERYQTKLL